MSASQTPDDMIRIEKKSALPIYAAGAVWLLFLNLRPLYKLSHFAMAGIVSLLAFLLCSKMFKPKVSFEPVPEAIPQTGDSAADSFLQEGAQYLKSIDALSDRVKNAAAKAKVDTLEQLIGQTLAYVEQNPKSVSPLGRFVSYYLPTLQKLVTTYVEMEGRNIQGENISSTLTAIEMALDTLQHAFRKQLDALYGNTALDITTDITVMESMLAQQGLKDDGNQFKLQ